MRVSGSGRGVGITEALHGYAEGPLLVAFAVLTQLGDVWLLLSVGSVLYVAGDDIPYLRTDRRRGLFVLALVMAYVALIGTLKHAFEFPRPPGATVAPPVTGLPPILEAIFGSITTADGSGFPSGHALGTTMVWGGLALTLDNGTRRQRLSIAGVVVVLVGVSRLVLGVHYAVDVLVGTALGMVVLGVLYRLSQRGVEPGRVLSVAAVVGVLGLALGVTFDSVAAAGSAIGAWLVWRVVADTTKARPETRREIVAGLVVLGMAGLLFATLYLTRPSDPAVLVGAALATGGVTGAPVLGQRLAERW